MATLASLVIATVLAGGGGTPVLLSFSSQHCAPCRSMAPVVDRLAAAGYPVQKIDVEQHPELASRFRITGVPCFVLLAGDQEVDRVLGATTFGRLQQMFAAFPANGPTAEDAFRIRGQSPNPDGANPAGNTSLPATPASFGPPRYDSPPSSSPFPGAGAPSPANSAVGPVPAPSAANEPNPAMRASSRSGAVQRALQASVRIRVEDANGIGTGTGTIIDTHGDEALVLTCGHLFRDSQGKGTVMVELFVAGAKQPVPGTVLDYHADEHDIALISIRPGVRVTTAPVAPAGTTAQKGASVFSIGCDRGDNPSVRTSEITGVDKYLGPPNVEVKGQPVDGRSGGGLFDASGQLIGICNAADPADDEGVYASLPNIHWLLDRVGLQHVYQRTQVASESARPTPPGARRTAPPVNPASAAAGSSLAATAPEMPRQMPGAATNLASAVPVSAPTPPGALPANDDTEVICIVRSRSNPNSNSELFVVNQPSAEFLAHLQQARRPGLQRVAAASRSLTPSASRPATNGGSAAGPPKKVAAASVNPVEAAAAAYASRTSAALSNSVVRGQSSDR